ncbi:DUF551 domain-containing protein [Actinobacillus equuli subsp. haemolyticus]|nr:DUF551 domain-containing protein [Actinobacillus equuli subsp. haemolyticus]
MIKHLPKIGEICHLTVKPFKNDTQIECLGYVDCHSSGLEIDSEEHFFDEDGNCYKYFVCIPELHQTFSVKQIVSWRPLGGWISVDDGLPEQGAYVLVCNGRCIVVAKLVGDIWSIPNPMSLSGLTVASGVTHWQPLPPRPQD